MKKISVIVFIVGVAACLSSCMKKENYPIVPAITYQNFIVNADNSADLQINFTDGDGDIGYQEGTSNIPPNFYMEFLEDTSGTGVFIPLIISTGTPDAVMGDTVFYSYNIPYITPAGKDKELSGQIQIALGAGQWYLQAPGKPQRNYKYVVWIIDRAGHKSNRITTPPVLSPPQ
ncbi:MAG TPA: hypothetical protein VK783_13615 [Bacteroidia bacterium]|jgi:hypothetical protein|nr:hypothetical protein [Bacteroidia bacterium]